MAALPSVTMLPCSNHTTHPPGGSTPALGSLERNLMSLGRPVRMVFALTAGVVISIAGGLATVATGTLTLGWVLVPCTMVAIDNMRMNDWAWLWLYGGIILNVALWTCVAWLILELLTGWSSHRACNGARHAPAWLGGRAGLRSRLGA